MLGTESCMKFRLRAKKGALINHCVFRAAKKIVVSSTQRIGKTTPRIDRSFVFSKYCTRTAERGKY